MAFLDPKNGGIGQVQVPGIGGDRALGGIGYAPGPPPPSIIPAVWGSVLAGVTKSNGDLTLTAAGGSDNAGITTVAVNSGKWYWEIIIDTLGAPRNDVGLNATLAAFPTYTWKRTGQIWDASFIAAWTAGDNLGFAYDADTNVMSMYKNGVFQVTTALPNGTYFATAAGLPIWGVTANFGQNAFVYPVPGGFNPGFGTIPP